MSEQPPPPSSSSSSSSPAAALRVPKSAEAPTSSLSPTSSQSQPPLTPTSSTHKKQSSIADILSTPPPISASSSSSAAAADLQSKRSSSSLDRRLSNASVISGDESVVSSSSLNTPIHPQTSPSAHTSAPGTAGSTSSSSNSSTSQHHISTSNLPTSGASGVIGSPTSTHSSISVAFSPRDWQDVQMNELVQRENLVYVDGNTTVEKAFDTLDQHKFTSLPIKVNPEDPSVSDTFDYADLTAYLLMVMGFIEPVNDCQEFKDYVHKARSGEPVPVKFAAQLGVKNELNHLKSTETIASAVEILGSGVHRIAILDDHDPHIVIGILSQRRLIRFIWENGRRFKTLEPFFQTRLSELGIGPKTVVSINGDRPVIDALKIMHQDGVSSLAVTDNNNNLLGNISIVDVRLVTKSSQKHLLRSPCKHFLSIILNERGLHDGQDSYPVFHVTLNSTVGRTIAKLVATKSHRLWIVQPSQQKPELGTPTLAVASGPGLNTTSGQLIGVISLTDILNMLAKQAGKQDLDPHSARRQRRRSSSSSSRSQASYDKFRRSISTDRSGR